MYYILWQLKYFFTNYATFCNYYRLRQKVITNDGRYYKLWRYYKLYCSNRVLNTPHQLYLYFEYWENSCWWENFLSVPRYIGKSLLLFLRLFTEITPSSDFFSSVLLVTCSSPAKSTKVSKTSIKIIINPFLKSKRIHLDWVFFINVTYCLEDLKKKLWVTKRVNYDFY